MNVSLEDQRRALLEQIEASRAVYRRMLAGENVARSSRVPPAARAALNAASGSAARPVAAVSSPAQWFGGKPGSGRSKVVQWAMEHPLWVAGGVALLVLLLPRMAVARRRGAPGMQPRKGSKPAQAVPQDQGPGIGRALLAAALLLLRDPARLQAASRLAGVGWRWLQHRRAR